MWTSKLRAALAALVLLLLGACGSTGNFMGTPASTTSASPSVSGSGVVSGYGVVQSIDMVPREKAGIGLGSVAGAVVGGVLGNQVGQGRGNTAATIAGAAGGALAGRQLEQNTRSSQVYRVTLRMDDGSIQTLLQETAPNVRIGDRVRVANGAIVQPY
jgi:outer membrane lipoprotein SlyB